MSIKSFTSGKNLWIASGIYVAIGSFIYLKQKSLTNKNYCENIVLNGKTVVITGATSGVGKLTAEILASRNAKVIMACRNEEKCAKVRSEIVEKTGNDQIFCRICDLTSFDSIRNFAKTLYAGPDKVDKIDCLINNAGIVQKDRKLSENGIELTLATNYMGPFLLTLLLLKNLIKQDDFSRIVNIGTADVFEDTMSFDDLNREKNHANDYEYKYRQSKLAQAIGTVEMANLLKDTKVTVNMVDPGRTAYSNLYQEILSNQWLYTRGLQWILGYFLGENQKKIVPQSVLYVVGDPTLEGVTGQVFRAGEKLQWGNKILNNETREQLLKISRSLTKSDEQQTKLREEIEVFNKNNKEKS